MVLAADYPLLDVIWTMIVFFAWVIWLWILVSILGDVFRRHDVSGWGKAGWTVLLIALPLLGVLIYMIANGDGMAQRNIKTLQSAATAGGPATEIALGQQLLDQGSITQEEFEAIKRKATAD